VPSDLPHVELYSDAPVGNNIDDRDGDGLTNEVEKRLGPIPEIPTPMATAFSMAGKFTA
jgi:hypothetical protein